MSRWYSTSEKAKNAADRALILQNLSILVAYPCVALMVVLSVYHGPKCVKDKAEEKITAVYHELMKDKNTKNEARNTKKEIAPHHKDIEISRKEAISLGFWGLWGLMVGYAHVVARCSHLYIDIEDRFNERKSDWEFTYRFGQER